MLSRSRKELLTEIRQLAVENRRLIEQLFEKIGEPNPDELDLVRGKLPTGEKNAERKAK